jgi:tetratricopeptide (TPR) repeat protein
MLGRYEAAIAAYSTSAGRYQHEPDSLAAYVQIANCYDRMQKPAEALSTLAQAQLILRQLPDDAFAVEPSAMSRDDWQRWLDWAMKLHN